MPAERLIHVVTFAPAPRVTWRDPRATRAASTTRDNPRHIAEIDGRVCGWGRSGRPDAGDFVMVSRFGSTERYEACWVHEDHTRGKQASTPIASWPAVDILDDEVRAG